MPVPRHAYGSGPDRPGTWVDILTFDAARYGGSEMGNYGVAQAVEDGSICSHTYRLESAVFYSAAFEITWNLVMEERKAKGIVCL
jgi:hypothetical protein